MAEPSDSDARGRPARKSATAYRTISEVSDALDVPQHVLRFWETKFTQVRPLKRGGGRRYYRPEDIQLLQKIQTLLYEDGYTIKGVQRLLREGKVDDDRETAVETVADLFGTGEADGTAAAAADGASAPASSTAPPTASASPAAPPAAATAPPTVAPGPGADPGHAPAQIDAAAGAAPATAPATAPGRPPAAGPSGSGVSVRAELEALLAELKELQAALRGD